MAHWREAQRSIVAYITDYYSALTPHQFNSGLTPDKAALFRGASKLVA